MAGVNADGIENRVHGHVGKSLLFVQRDAQLFEGREQLGVHVLDFLMTLFGLRGGVVDDVLQVHWRKVQFTPVRLLHRLELFIGFQSEIEHELRFFAQG